MKMNKILLIIQAIGMYVLHLPLYIALILLKTPIEEEALNAAISGLGIAFIVILVIVFPICIINAVSSFISIFKGDYNPSKTTMIVKFALIPWYIMNFFICAVIVAGLMNPWLMLTVPFAIVFLMGFTYIFMLATGLPDIAYFFNRLIKRELKVTPLLIFSLVFLFIFCLDIVGGLTYYIEMKPKE